jgi:zinc D-Ala-D-Ala carboxypeptidase
VIITTPNFSLAEVLRASAPLTIGNISSEPMASNIGRTLRMLEKVRVTVGSRPVVITSLARSREENDSLPGASSTSAHLSGLAADIQVDGLTAEEVMAIVAPQVRQLEIDQAILYHTHVHLSADRRGRGMTLDARFGTPFREWKPRTAPIVTTASAPVPDANARSYLPGCGTLIVAVAIIGTSTLL